MPKQPSITQKQAIRHAFDLLKDADHQAQVGTADAHATACRALGWLKLAESGVLAPGGWDDADFSGSSAS